MYLVRRTIEVIVAATLVSGVVILGAISQGRSEEAVVTCPLGVKSCKVITITPDEEQSLTGDNMIFAHAEWANRTGMGPLVNAWRIKLQTAPAGKVAITEKK